MDKKIISVVVPCYNEQDVLPMFYETIKKIAAEMQEKHSELEFEFLFINDGSRDKTLELLRKYSLDDERVRYICFSRNFGKEAGIYAGLENARGDYVVTLDADLQHPPELIKQMYEYILSGEYDCAATRRVSRKGEPKLKSFFSRMFYKIINRISDTEIIDGAQDYRFMTRQMVNSILEMKEYNRFSKGIFSWVGFRTKYIEVENVERAAGTTTWSFKKLFLYSLEGIFEFSTAMLNMPMYIGLLFGVITIAELVIYFVKPDFIGNDASMKILITGIACLIFICMGINNQYFSKMYLEVKARPKYLIRETEESYKAKNR